MNKKDLDHDRRRRVILRLVKLHGINVSNYDQIPEEFKTFYSHFDYMSLIRPLLTIDRKNGLSYGQLANKFGITYRRVEYHFCCWSLYTEEEE